jgi:hypothetical protein
MDGRAIGHILERNRPAKVALNLFRGYYLNVTFYQNISICIIGIDRWKEKISQKNTDMHR